MELLGGHRDVSPHLQLLWGLGVHEEPCPELQWWSPLPQDLLQLQYEGVAVMKMFGKAKVNVNLLIFLLNKKFFKK